jgi:hypothetical protein
MVYAVVSWLKAVVVSVWWSTPGRRVIANKHSNEIDAWLVFKDKCLYRSVEYTEEEEEE